MTIVEQLSKKYVHTRWVYIDGWTAAHLLLGILVTTIPVLANRVFDLLIIPQYSLFWRFMWFSVMWESFEWAAHHLWKIQYFKEPNIDIVYDLAANMAGFWIGTQII